MLPFNHNHITEVKSDIIKPMDAKEEVRAKLNIEDVIGEYVPLKRAGRSFKGISPFTSEKTPSFFVSPDKNIWHDFSSNKGGDIFSFVMEVEGMDFRQALEHLARKAGVDLSLYEKAGSRGLGEKKKRLLEAHRLIAQYYQHSLLRNQHALEYVVKARGLNKKTIQDFLIGYAPDTGAAAVEYLTKKGFSKQEINQAGLLNRFGGDIFRGRMMVPLMDGTGQVIGFTGRIIGEVPNAPKYLNTPQTLLYDKGRHIFALSQAKEAIRESGHVVVVEGNLDVVSSHQAGVRQVVATAGTAMTEHHLKAFKRLTPDVRLCYDGDKAGIAATERAIAMASETGVELSVISLPEGVKDPDELIQKDVDAWRAAIAARQPAVEWILAQYSQRVDLKTASGKRAFTTAALGVVNGLHDPVEREHYERVIAELTNTSIEAVHAKFDAAKAAPKTLRTINVEKTAPVEEAYPHEDDVLALAAVDPASQELFAHFDPAMLHGEARQGLAQYFAAHHGQVLADTPKALQEYDEYVKIVLLRADARYVEWDPNDRYFEAARLLRQIENENKKQKQATLIAELREAEDRADETRAQELRIALNELIKEIARGKR